MEFTVLGPIGMIGDRSVDLGGPRIRRLLAVLLIDADSVVSTDRLLEIVFGGSPTPGARGTLRTYLARLRRAIEESGAPAQVVRESPGYRLETRSTAIDARRFEELVDRGRGLLRSDPATAATLLRKALDLWRGPAYAEFADEEWALTEAVRLDELRLVAEEELFDAVLATERHQDVIPNLLQFVGAHPWRERAQMSAMVALYRAGRQADAMRQGRVYREELVEVGLEASPEFAELERRIASNDPDLLHPARPALRGYALVDEIAAGRRGSVSIAVQPGVGREVAIRSFVPALADDADFIREMEPIVRRVARIEHPNIVAVVDYWREPGAAFLVTRLMRGGTLLDVIAKGPAVAPLVGVIVADVGLALQAAHDLGLCHGALSPAEVLLDEGGTAHVDGIEVERLLDDIAGTAPPLGYRRDPPGTRGPAVDQYALAAIAFELLTGQQPHGGEQDGESTARFPLVSDLRPELVAVDGVLARAGAIEPADRYPDVGTFVQSFSAAIGHATEPGMSLRPNPYQGLRPFAEADADRFFGRDDELRQLLGLVERAGHAIVVGASGSGKSSLVAAGLVPSVRSGHIDASGSWYITTMRPGSDPVGALRAALDAVGGPTTSSEPDDGDMQDRDPLVRAADPTVLLVVDQLEEVLTRAPADQRDAFLDALDALLRTGFRLVATLRADHYEEALQHPPLGRLLVDGALPLLGLDPADVAAAIAGPAASVGVEIDGDLVAQLASEASGRPTVLPLLQFAMTELYERAITRRITLSDYELGGGLAAVVGERAERIFAALGDGEQRIVRAIFVRLVEPGPSRTVIARQARRAELAALAGADDVEAVLEQFVTARLIGFDIDPVTREPTVGVAHESLFWSWPRLAAWIEEEGEGLAIRSGITDAAVTWDEGEHDADDLLRGARLATAEEWFTPDRVEALTEIERRFLGESISHRDRQLAQQRRTNARLRRRLIAVGTLLVLAVVAGLFAFVQGRRASDQADVATAARARALAAASTSVLDEDRTLGLLLAVEANRLDDSTPARRALLEGLAGDEGLAPRVIPTPAADYSALAVSRDGRLAAARRADGSIDVVDLVDRSVLHSALPSPMRPMGALSIDPSARWIASGGSTGGRAAVVVYAAEDGTEVARYERGTGATAWTGFAPDGSSLVVSDDLGNVVVLEPGTWAERRQFKTGLRAQIPELTFSADGAVVYLSEWGSSPDVAGNLYAVDIMTGDFVAGPVQLPGSAVVSMAVGADGTLFAGEERLSRHDGDTLETLGSVDVEAQVAFLDLAVMPDGRVLAADPAGLQVVTFFEGEPAQADPFEMSVSGVEALSEDGRFVTAGAPGILATWNDGTADPLGVPLAPAGPGFVDVSSDGELLVVWGWGRGVQLFDRATLEHLGELEYGSDISLLGIDFSPDGSRIAVLSCPFGEHSTCDASVDVWSLDARRRTAGPASIGPVWLGGATSGVAFAKGGDAVVTAGAGVQVLDSETLEPLTDVVLPSAISPVSSDVVAMVSAADVDGRSLMVATSDTGQALVYGWEDDRLEPLVELEAIPAIFLDDGTFVTGIANGPFVARDPISFEQVGPVVRSPAPTNMIRMAGPSMIITEGHARVQLWDRETGEPASGPFGAAISAVAPDGGTLYLGAVDGGEVRAVSLSPEFLQEEACRRAGRNLTGEEWRSLMGEDEPYAPTCPQWPDVVDIS